MSRNHSQMNRKRWRRLRHTIFDRDGWRCRSCGKAGRLECDHITPLSKGGEYWDADNLQALCRACHIAKTTGETETVLPPGVGAWRDLVGARLNDAS